MCHRFPEPLQGDVALVCVTRAWEHDALGTPAASEQPHGMPQQSFGVVATEGWILCKGRGCLEAALLGEHARHDVTHMEVHRGEWDVQLAQRAHQLWRYSACTLPGTQLQSRGALLPGALLPTVTALEGVPGSTRQDIPWMWPGQAGTVSRQHPEGADQSSFPAQSQGHRGSCCRVQAEFHLVCRGCAAAECTAATQNSAPWMQCLPWAPPKRRLEPLAAVAMLVVRQRPQITCITWVRLSRAPSEAPIQCIKCQARERGPLIESNMFIQVGVPFPASFEVHVGIRS